MRDHQLKIRRDELLAQCKVKGIKMDRTGMTVKQQVAYMTTLLGKN